MSCDLRLKFALQARIDCLGAGVMVRREAARYGWPPVASQELALLVTELCNNAVRHGGGGVCITTVGTDRVEVEVKDSGPGFPPRTLAGEAPDALAPRGGLGEGLACARRLSTTLMLENPSGGGARAVAVRLAV